MYFSYLSIESLEFELDLLSLGVRTLGEDVDDGLLVGALKDTHTRTQKHTILRCAH